MKKSKRRRSDGTMGEGGAPALHGAESIRTAESLL